MNASFPKIHHQVGKDLHCWESHPVDMLTHLFSEETFVHLDETWGVEKSWLYAFYVE